MVDPGQKLNIVPKNQTEFRPEKNKQELLNLQINIETLDNEHPDYKEIHLLHGNEQIGKLNFKQNLTEGNAKINQATIDNKYSGNDLGIKLYESLIVYARENKLKRIKSDEIVQGGAIGTWIKLSDKYKVLVHPDVQKEYDQFVKIYKENKFFKKYLSVARPNESVFELIVE